MRSVSISTVSRLTDQLPASVEAVSYTHLGEPDLAVYEIGDCVKAGKILDAFHTAYKTAVRI